MIEQHSIEGIGSIIVSRRKGTKNIRISISQNGIVRLSLPYRISTKRGIDYLLTKKDWVTQHQVEQLNLDDGAMLGSTVLRLHTGHSNRIRSVHKQSELHVFIPEHMQHEELQSKLQTAAKKCLQKQAASLLTQLQTKSIKAGYAVSGSSLAFLKSRWGSCSSKNEIVINAYLIQLPQECIDYVLWHELAHTKHHNHSPLFWQELEIHVPNYKNVKKKLKKYPTTVFDSREFIVHL